MGVSLLHSVYLHVRDIECGTYKGGTGPNSKTIKKRNLEKDTNRGVRLGQDVIKYGISMDNKRGNSTNTKHEEMKMLATRKKKVKLSMRVREEIKDGPLSRRYKVCSGPKGTKSFMAKISNICPCACGDFETYGKKVKCKHLLFILTHCLLVPDGSPIFSPTFLGDEEVKQIFEKAHATVPVGFLIPKAGRQSKNYSEISKKTPNPKQRWKLGHKVSKSALCRTCKTEIFVRKKCLLVEGALTIPFQKEVAVEMLQYFCVKSTCIRYFPPWTNVLPPSSISADNIITEEEGKEIASLLDVSVNLYND